MARLGRSHRKKHVNLKEIQFEKGDLPVNCKETSREELLAKFLTDEALTDMALQGKDGVRVRANRHILAARSAVFYNMLLGEFAEASKGVVQIGYDGIVLQSVVQYILTDHAPLLNLLPPKESTQLTIEDTVRIQAMVSLAGAGIYFDLPLLCEMAFAAVARSLENTPSLAFAVLEAYHQEGPTLPTLKDLAMSYFFSVGVEEFNAVAVATLTPPSIQVILEEKQLKMDEFQRFEILRLWVEAAKFFGMDPAASDRPALAAQMTQYLHLEHIHPRILSTTVATSGLVSQEQLQNAYQKQALLPKETYERTRAVAEWESSGTNLTTSEADQHGGDVLKFTPMNAGVYLWTLDIEEDAALTWLGVAIKRDRVDYDFNAFLGNQNGAYLIGGHGETPSFRDGHNIRAKHFACKFGTSSRVTFRLDLLPNRPGNGTLSISVHNQPPIEIYTDLRGCLVEEAGFVPAVSLRRPGKVRLLEITKLRN